MKKFFKPGDFEMLSTDAQAVIASKIANKLLANEMESSEIVYTDEKRLHLSFVDEVGFTHKGRLAFVEKIEECRHEARSNTVTLFPDGDMVFVCVHCGVYLKPSWSVK